MEIVAISKFEDFLCLEDTWNNLLEKSHNDIVFLRHEWFKSWWLGFGKDKRLFVLIIRDGENIVGIAPLMKYLTRYRGITVREVGFIQNDNSPRADFIIVGERQKILACILEYLKQCRTDWDILRLVNIPKESPVAEILPDILVKLKMNYGIKEGLQSPFIKIGSDWESFFQSKSAKFRKVLRNKINRMQRLGSYTIQKFEHIGNNGEPLNNIFEISQNSWKAKIQKDITTNSQNKIFFRELSRIASERGWLKIWLLTLENKPIAYEYHLKYQNKEYALRADFNEKYRESHPGSVLDAHIMQNIFENNLEEYDMGGSNDLYKRNWTYQVKNHSHFLIFNRNFKSLLLYILESKIIVFIKYLGNPVRKSYSRAYQIYKSQGINTLIARVLTKVLNFIITTNSAEWFERDLLKLPEFRIETPIEVDLNCNKETIEWIKNREESWLFNPKEIAGGLKNNHYFPAVRYKGNIIGCAKVGIGNVYIADFKQIIKFPEEMVFIYDTFILPEYRGKGIAPYLIVEVMKFAITKGFKRVRCHIPDWNKASINAYTKIGFKKIKNIRCMRIMGLSILTSNPADY